MRNSSIARSTRSVPPPVKTTNTSEGFNSDSYTRRFPTPCKNEGRNIHTTKTVKRQIRTNDANRYRFQDRFRFGRREGSLSKEESVLRLNRFEDSGFFHKGGNCIIINRRNKSDPLHSGVERMIDPRDRFVDLRRSFITDGHGVDAAQVDYITN